MCFLCPNSKRIRILLCIEEKDKRKVALKLHQQFAHAPSKRIISLVYKDANVEDHELFKSIIDAEDNCQICKRYKRPQLKPAVQKEGEETTSVDDGGRKHQVETEQTCESEKDGEDVSEEREEDVISVAPNVTQGQNFSSDS